MRRLFVTLLLLLGFSGVASAKDSAKGFCEEPNRPVVTSGLNSTTRVQSSHPSCIITVYTHGAGLATIYADNNGTPLANPFTAQSNGQWQFYAANGRYDVTTSSAGFAQTLTYSDILLCDPFEAGSTCNNGGSTTAHNLLSTTHLDTIPASPPTRGDIITAQNQTSPTGVNPSWARLPLGTATYVLTSDGTDAVWAPAAGGSGCTPPGTDTGVLSEHPVGTCYDSLHWTWDDGLNKQNMLLGDGTNAVTSNSELTFIIGTGSRTLAGGGGGFFDTYLIGDSDSVTDGTVGAENFYMFGINNFANDTGGSIWLIGDSNGLTALDDPGGAHQQIYAFGKSNLVHSTTSSVAPISDCFLIGEGNEAKSLPTGGGLGGCILDGFSNQVLITAGTALYFDIGLYGEANILTGTVNGIQRTHILGNGNTVEDTLALSDQVTIVGDSNDVDGSISTVQILGFKNVAHNVSAQNSSTVNTTLVGSAIAATNTGASGTPAYQGAFGASITLSNCNNCWAIGQRITNSTSDTMAIGLSTSATPTMIITKNGTGDYTKFTAHAFSYYPACAAGTEGSVAAITDSSTVTWGATITGSSTNHVMGYCDGTNWTVMAK